MTKKFSPVSRYYQAIDAVLCVAEDVSYRSQPVNRFLEVLWHPSERYLVGIKILHAKRIYSTFTEWPKDRPMGLLFMVCAAFMEAGNDHASGLWTVVLRDFLQQHGESLDISPEEQARIAFTLVKPNWRVSVRGGTGYTLVPALEIEEALTLGAEQLGVPVTQLEVDKA